MAANCNNDGEEGHGKSKSSVVGVEVGVIWSLTKYWDLT